MMIFPLPGQSDIFVVDLSIMFGSFKLFLLLYALYLATNLKDFVGNPGLFPLELLNERYFCCYCYNLVEFSDYEVQFSIFVYQHSKSCKSTTDYCLESPHCWGIIQFP